MELQQDADAPVKARLIDRFGPLCEDCEELVGFQGLLVCLCRGYWSLVSCRMYVGCRRVLPLRAAPRGCP
jgi:hypothetical protein